MQEGDLLISEIKNRLKLQKITYREVGRALGLSEPSIKRKFSNKVFSIDEIFRLCRLLRVELNELHRPSEVSEYELTSVQEQMIASDPKLFAFVWPLINGVSLSRIRKRFKLSVQKAESYLLKLDRVGIVDFRGEGRYQVKIPSRVKWKEDGPIEKRILSHAIPKLMSETPKGEVFLRTFFLVKLPKHQAVYYQDKFDRLTRELYAVSIREGLEEPKPVTVGLSLLYRSTQLSLVKLAEQAINRKK